MGQETEQKTTYHLKMSSRHDLRPSEKTAAGFEVRRVEIACPEYNWFLHQDVGTEYRWGGREDWGRQEWAEYVDRPELETWVAYVAGTPLGYYELEKQGDGSVRIECFGLRSQFLGQGLGGALLTKAIERCWQMGANRVWLNTCSHDHAHALQNYLARGFKIDRKTTSPPNSGASIIALFAGLLTSQVLRSTYWSYTTRTSGLDYNSRPWRESIVGHRLREMLSVTPLYSNLPEVVYFLVGKQAYPIAYAPCITECSSFEADIQAVANKRHDEPVIVWVPGHGETECNRCLSAPLLHYGFRLIAQDEQFQLYGWAGD